MLNLEHISHISFDPEASVPGMTITWPECVVSFVGTDECQVFAGEEAEIVWSFIKPFCTAFLTNREKVA